MAPPVKQGMMSFPGTGRFSTCYYVRVPVQAIQCRVYCRVGSCLSVANHRTGPGASSSANYNCCITQRTLQHITHGPPPRPTCDAVQQQRRRLYGWIMGPLPLITTIPHSYSLYPVMMIMVSVSGANHIWSQTLSWLKWHQNVWYCREQISVKMLDYQMFLKHCTVHFNLYSVHFKLQLFKN